MNISFRENTQDQTVIRDVFHGNEYRLPKAFAKTDVIVDVGGHIGLFALSCIYRGAGLVVSIEPNADNCRLYLSNVPRGRSELHQAAAWRSDMAPGEVKMFMSSHYTACHRADLLDLKMQPEPETVKTLPLDAVLRRFETVRLLKLDCEFSEYPILFTSQELGRCQEIVGEYHVYKMKERFAYPCDSEGLRQRLAEFGFASTVKEENVNGVVQGKFWAKKTVTDARGIV